MFHDTLGHAGMNQTFHILHEHVYWPGIKSDVEIFVRSCHACQTRKCLAVEPETLHEPAIYGPLQHVHVDLAGPFEVAATGDAPKHKEWDPAYRDHFTKVAEFEPISDKYPTTISRVFLNSWVYRYGAPQYVTSDNGTEFQAEFNALLCRLGAEHIFTSAEHPQANGAVERLVRSLKEALSRHIGNQYSAWKQSLPALRYAHMLKMHRATGFAPFELLMGHKASCCPASLYICCQPCSYIFT